MNITPEKLLKESRTLEPQLQQWRRSAPKSHSSFTSPARNCLQLDSMFSFSILCISALMSSPFSTLWRWP